MSKRARLNSNSEKIKYKIGKNDEIIKLITNRFDESDTNSSFSIIDYVDNESEDEIKYKISNDNKITKIVLSDDCSNDENSNDSVL